LDAETLELLEELLIDYQGTVLLVSHDREFLNNVVTSTIVFEDGQIAEYVGGYDDWVRQREEREKARAAAKPPSPPRAKTPPPAPPAAARAGRLSFKEQQELAALPGRIEQLEADIAELHRDMASPEFYRRSGEEIAAEAARLRDLEEQLAAAYGRWEELEARAG
jgi:ATP-binding cassette subfamily F protein uup